MASSGLSLSGLASGVDTSSIVSQLMAIERQSTTRLQLSQTKLQTRDAALKDVQGKLTALKTAATALREPKLWTPKQGVESSDATKVGVEMTGGAAIGATSIDVLNLASSSQRAFAFAPASAARTLTLQPSAPGAPAASIPVAADATVDALAAAINERTDLPVYAAVVVPDPAQPTVKQLVLSSRATGAASDFSASLDDGSLTAAGTPRLGADARYRVDGDPTVRTSATNVVENAIPGLKLTLKGATSSAVSINATAPAVDTAAVKAKVTAFVNAYNDVVNTTRAKTTEKAVPGATTTTDALKGQLFGDIGLTSMVSGMRRGMTDAVDGNPVGFDSLADLGITTGAIGSRSTSGTLVIDDAKLTAALAADTTAVRRMLGGIAGTDGLAQRVEGLVSAQVGTGGLIDGRLTNSSNDQRRITDQITRNNVMLDKREARLKAQFAAMESALQASQTQQSWLSGQLAQLSGA